SVWLGPTEAASKVLYLQLICFRPLAQDVSSEYGLQPNEYGLRSTCAASESRALHLLYRERRERDIHSYTPTPTLPLPSLPFKCATLQLLVVLDLLPRSSCCRLCHRSLRRRSPSSATQGKVAAWLGFDSF
ncbi:hypothetical protein CUMW_083320, partial [Citrus unshiu]